MNELKDSELLTSSVVRNIFQYSNGDQELIHYILNEAKLSEMLLIQLANGEIQINENCLLKFMGHLFTFEDHALFQMNSWFYYACYLCKSLRRDVREMAMKLLSKQKIQPELGIVMDLISNDKNIGTLFSSNQFTNKTSLNGLFIQLLEDEYMNIRINTIQTITNLSKQDAQFSKEVRSILMYMLNDEMDHVRIETIHALKQMYGTLDIGSNKSEIEIILFNVQESNMALRVASYDLIGCCALRDVLYVINMLCCNYAKYPNDFEFLGKCLMDFAIRNMRNIKYVPIDQLLNRQEISEPNWFDEEYVLRMVVIYNSQHLEQLPYFNKHFDYFIDKYPSFFKQKFENKSNLLLAYQYLKEGDREKLLFTQFLFDTAIYKQNGALAGLEKREFKFVIKNSVITGREFTVIGKGSNLKQPINEKYVIGIILADQKEERSKLKQVGDVIISEVELENVLIDQTVEVGIIDLETDLFVDSKMQVQIKI